MFQQISKHVRKSVPLFLFLIIFIVFLLLFLSLFRGVQENFNNSLSLIAWLYMLPIVYISGSAVAFYFLEAIGVLRIKRKRKLGIILVILMGLFLVWVGIVFARHAGPNPGELFGKSVQNVITALPDAWFSVQICFVLASYLQTPIIMLFYEACGAILFYAIGSTVCEPL